MTTENDTPTQLRAWFEHRRAVRNRMESADQVIEHWEDRVRRCFPGLPAIEAEASDIEATSTAQMTVATEWLAAMLVRAHQMGREDERTLRT